MERFVSRFIACGSASLEGVIWVIGGEFLRWCMHSLGVAVSMGVLAFCPNGHKMCPDPHGCRHAPRRRPASTKRPYGISCRLGCLEPFAPRRNTVPYTARQQANCGLGEEQCLQHQTKTPPNPPNHPQTPYTSPTTTPQVGRGTQRGAQKGASPQERHGTQQGDPEAKANAQDEASIGGPMRRTRKRK